MLHDRAIREPAVAPAQGLVGRVRAWFARRDPGYFWIVAIFLFLLPLSTPRVALSDEVQYYAYLR